MNTKFVLLGTKHDLEQYLYDHAQLLDGFIRIHAIQCYIINEIKDIILSFEYDSEKYKKATESKRGYAEIRDESKNISRSLINEIKSECECVEFMETSSKDNFNVNEMFTLAADLYFAIHSS